MEYPSPDTDVGNRVGTKYEGMHEMCLLLKSSMDIVSLSCAFNRYLSSKEFKSVISGK